MGPWHRQQSSDHFRSSVACKGNGSSFNLLRWAGRQVYDSVSSYTHTSATNFITLMGLLHIEMLVGFIQWKQRDPFSVCISAKSASLISARTRLAKSAVLTGSTNTEHYKRHKLLCLLQRYCFGFSHRRLWYCVWCILICTSSKEVMFSFCVCLFWNLSVFSFVSQKVMDGSTSN